MVSYLRRVFTGFWSLVEGMAVTLRYMFKKPVTVLYPYEEVATKRFKGPIAFTECCGQGACSVEPNCSVGSNWKKINQVVTRALQAVTLADMVHPMGKAADFRISV